MCVFKKNSKTRENFRIYVQISGPNSNFRTNFKISGQRPGLLLRLLVLLLLLLLPSPQQQQQQQYLMSKNTNDVIHQQNQSTIPNNFQSVVDGGPVQNRHVLGIGLVHVTAAFDELHASFQHAILSSPDNVESLVVIGQLLRL